MCEEYLFTQEREINTVAHKEKVKKYLFSIVCTIQKAIRNYYSIKYKTIDLWVKISRNV